MFSHSCRSLRLLISAGIVFSAITMSILVAPDNASAYDCITAPNTTGHCYAKNNWHFVNILGGYTHVSLFNTLKVTDPLGRITMEMWVFDRGSSVCPSGFLCWTEAGYTWAAGPTDCYNQGTGCLRYFHAERVYPTGYQEMADFPPVPQGDLDRGDIGIEIWESQDHQWCAIYIYAAANNYSIGVHVPMYMDEVQVGAELSGTSGAHGQETWFNNNIYLDLSYNAVLEVNPDPVGGNNDPTVTDGSVLYGDFYIRPSISSNGGTWRAIPPPP